MSRHRGAKHRRRYELLGGISLLSPGTFYPLSDGPSIQNHRITMTCFRTCSRRHARSQAGLCHCTNLLMSDRGLANLRAPPLLFRRRPPQSNYPPDTVRNPDHGSTLEHQTLKGGISRSAPCRLASTLQSLPPILHIKAQCSVSSYGKGSRGLSVLPRVHCIFTASSISLSLGWRQHSHHYAIRAGRNLPDKEFRYLRTVIVTAAVYRGFDQELRLR